MRTGAAAAALFATLGALVAIERALAPRTRPGPAAIERLVPPEALANRTTAAFSIESAGVERLYVRSKGLWRCREAFGAVCASDAVESLLGSLLETRGALGGLGPAGAERAGLLAPDGLRLTLHGSKVLGDPARDVLARLAFGPLRAGATFASLDGSGRVLAVDLDPRRFLESAGRPAPLVDTRLLAGCFPPGFAGFERMFVDQGGTSLELTSDAPDAESPERRWFVSQGGAREPAILWRIGGYTSLWIRLRYDEPADPRLVAALGLDPPQATITLAPNVGEPFEIRVSAPDAANRVHVWNRATNVVARLQADLLPLLVPALEDFTRIEGGNPWERWLAPR